MDGKPVAGPFIKNVSSDASIEVTLIIVIGSVKHYVIERVLG
jgi:hypothetical protein